MILGDVRISKCSNPYSYKTEQSKNTYYYLTHSSDVNNLKATAANFELIENLLQVRGL